MGESSFEKLSPEGIVAKEIVNDLRNNDVENSIFCRKGKEKEDEDFFKRIYTCAYIDLFAPFIDESLKEKLEHIAKNCSSWKRLYAIRLLLLMHPNKKSYKKLISKAYKEEKNNEVKLCLAFLFGNDISAERSQEIFEFIDNERGLFYKVNRMYYDYSIDRAIERFRDMANERNTFKSGLYIRTLGVLTEGGFSIVNRVIDTHLDLTGISRKPAINVLFRDSQKFESFMDDFYNEYTKGYLLPKYDKDITRTAVLIVYYSEILNKRMESQYFTEYRENNKNIVQKYMDFFEDQIIRGNVRFNFTDILSKKKYPLVIGFHVLEDEKLTQDLDILIDTQRSFTGIPIIEIQLKYRDESGLKEKFDFLSEDDENNWEKFLELYDKGNWVELFNSEEIFDRFRILGLKDAQGRFVQLMSGIEIDTFYKYLFAMFKFNVISKEKKGKIFKSVYLSSVFMSSEEETTVFGSFLFNSLEYTSYADFFELYRDARNDLSALKSLELEYLRHLYSTKIAIITILVDSYAHNISAHSIQAIEKWMRENAIRVEKRYKIGKKALRKPKNKLNKHALGSIAEMAGNYYGLLGQGNGTYSKKYFSLLDLIYFDEKWNQLGNKMIYKGLFGQGANLKFNFPSDYLSWRFMKYLKEKAAFWNGVTRYVLFSGLHMTMYDLLWDFVNNPLFLGTIAASEGIYKLNVFVAIGHTIGADFSRKKPLLKEGELKAGGEFAKIDMSLMNDKFESHKIKYGENEITYSAYGVFRPGENFKSIKSELDRVDYAVYLPGGIVGKQAFYTILENTIRNIKHVNDLDKAIEKGINLCIEITPVEDRIGEDNRCLKWFKIGVYFKHKSKLVYRVNNEDICVDDRINELSRASLLDENGNPKMGGNSQDKICASMLYNNDYETVEDRTKDSYKDSGPNIYPWIDAKTINVENVNEGYLIKNFYLWKGDFMIDNIDLERENMKRFKFFNGTIGDARENDVIRFCEREIIEPVDDKQKEEIYAEIYKEWLERWLKKDYKIRRIEVTNKGETTRGCYDLDGKIKSENCKDNVIELKYKHRAAGNISGGILNYRSHGAFNEYFHKGNLLRRSKLKYFEFIEMILTRVLVIDNRIFNVLNEENSSTEKSENTRLSNLKEGSLLEISPESNNLDIEWNLLPRRYNFVVIHLSYIESVLGYTESRFERFILDTIMRASKRLPGNFILVITTARGRSLWWDTLNQSKDWKKHYRKFVTFRPIESMIDAVSDGKALNDDFQIKYNLVKILFGS